jgi:hypothetical protein
MPSFELRGTDAYPPPANPDTARLPRRRQADDPGPALSYPARYDAGLSRRQRERRQSLETLFVLVAVSRLVVAGWRTLRKKGTARPPPPPAAPRAPPAPRPPTGMDRA